jgi:AraC-like DNA-binding protein
MEARVIRLGGKTGAPYYAREMTLHRTGRYRARDFFDVVAIVAGEGWHVSYAEAGEPRTQRLSAGQMVLYRPIDDLNITGAPPQGMSVKFVSFPAAEWETFANMVGIDLRWMTAPEPPITTFDIHDESVIQPFDVAIERFHHEPTALDLVQFWIGIIPTMFPGSQRRLPGAGAPAWLIESIESMREEQNLRGGVARLLALAHVSPAHLAVTVRRYFDKTPTELVLHLRLRHATLLLSAGSESVGEIAVRCGFGSFAYFSTAFRRQYHVTPREYRAHSLRSLGGERAGVTSVR